MRTIITYKGTDLAPELKEEFEGLAPSFNFYEDTVDLLDYDNVVQVAEIPIKKTKSIVWDEQEGEDGLPNIAQIVDDYIQLRLRAGVPVDVLRKAMSSKAEAIGSSFEHVQLLAITRATTINDEE